MFFIFLAVLAMLAEFKPYRSSSLGRREAECLLLQHCCQRKNVNLGICKLENFFSILTKLSSFENVFSIRRYFIS